MEICKLMRGAVMVVWLGRLVGVMVVDEEEDLSRSRSPYVAALARSRSAEITVGR